MFCVTAKIVSCQKASLRTPAAAAVALVEVGFTTEHSVHILPPYVE